VSAAPEIIQEVPANLTAVAIPFWAKVLFPVVPAEAKYMVSDVIDIVTALADILIKLIAVPVAYATEAFAGIV